MPVAAVTQGDVSPSGQRSMHLAQHVVHQSGALVFGHGGQDRRHARELLHQHPLPVHEIFAPPQLFSDAVHGKATATPVTRLDIDRLGTRPEGLKRALFTVDATHHFIFTTQSTKEIGGSRVVS